MAITSDQINRNIERIRNKYSGVQGGADLANREIAQLASQYGVGAGQIASATGMDAVKAQTLMQKYGPGPQPVSDPVPQPVPQYGLGGAENALITAGNLGNQQIQQTMQDVSGIFNQGMKGLNPFIAPGQQANDQQAALSGALGPEAQAAAMEAYQSSPFLDQARTNAERAITRNASALGGLGSGNTLDQLYQNAAGMFLGDFNDNFSRLGEVANRGYGAATTGAGLSGQEAGIQAGLGQTAAQIPLGLGGQIGEYRYQAGRDIANSIGSTTSGLAGLSERQGAGLSDITGNVTNNINSLLQNYYQGDAQSLEQLASLLSNLAVQGSSQYSGMPIIPGMQSNLLGQLGQVASGTGGLLQGLNAAGLTA